MLKESDEFMTTKPLKGLLEKFENLTRMDKITTLKSVNPNIASTGHVRSHMLTEDPPGCYTTCSSSVDSSHLLSVTQLRRIFEQLCAYMKKNSESHSLMKYMESPMQAMGLIREKIEKGDIVPTKKNGSLDVDHLVHQLVQESIPTDQNTASTFNNDTTSLQRPTTPIQQTSHSIQLPNILTPSKKKSHDCDMIVCGVKSFTVNGHKVHEIDLKCHSCSSQFLLTAAHDCELEESEDELMALPDQSTAGCILDDEHEEDEEGDAVVNSQRRPPSPTKANIKSGLEWFKHQDLDLVNMII